MKDRRIQVWDNNESCDITINLEGIQKLWFTTDLNPNKAIGSEFEKNYCCNMQYSEIHACGNWTPSLTTNGFSFEDEHGIDFCLFLDHETCSDGKWFQGSCYKFSGRSTKVARDVAMNACASDGSHLAIITSAEEQHFVDDFLKENNANIEVWFDLHLESGEYVWSDGSPLQFTAWLPDQPNNDGNCNRLRYREGKYGWADLVCSHQYNYLCEMEGIQTYYFTGFFSWLPPQFGCDITA